ncbi:MAG: OmpA family protein [Bacteroidetes bacterium]|nr:OmpA family protein [Bacteroidota bacterium]
MNKTLWGILTFLFIFPIGIIAQSKYTKTADDAFADQMFSTALTRYQKAYSKVKNNKGEKDRISFRMAECYRMMNNMKKSEIAYKRLATGKYADKEPKVILYYADALKFNGNYSEAIKQYQLYKEKVPTDERGTNGVETCKLAKEWVANPSKYQVSWEKKINSKDDDFAPCYSDKTHRNLIFTSDRPAATGKDVDNWTGLEFSDLFLSRKDQKGEWNNPVLIDQNEVIDTKANEGASQFNSRYTAMYFTRCWIEPGRKDGCAIYRAGRMGTNAWSEAEKLPILADSSRSVGHPTITADEGTIYFSADLPGGKGGKDIWMATKQGKSKSSGWSKPENLGPIINSTGDELFPFIRDDSVLYFASNGLPGMGGLDIFRSVKVNGLWTKPENMKYPINTSYDDFAIIFNPDEPEEGYFSSNRPGGKGRDDIYSFVVPPLIFTLAGNITDDRTLQVVGGAEVRITGTNGKSAKFTTDEKGHYSFNKNQFSPATTYEIMITKKDYFNEKGKETTVGLERSKDFTRNFVLKPIPKKPVVLPDILYDLDKWDLKPQFQDSLQGLIQTLDANENIVVELASHTDSRGTDERNDVLSQRRAQSVVDYLISRGIDPDRLLAKGYGKRVPRILAKDITKDDYLFKTGTPLIDSVINGLPNTQAKEAAHSLNRRTEFSIVRNDYIPKTKPGKQVASKIEVVQNPEENSVSYTKTKDGLLEGTCYVDGITMTFDYDKAEKEFFISPSEAMKLLKDGIIDKNDFRGDATKAIGEGTIANKAVFTVKEFRIGKNTIRGVDVTVNNKIKNSVQFGPGMLAKFGAYTFDDTNNQIVFGD